MSDGGAHPSDAAADGGASCGPGAGPATDLDAERDTITLALAQDPDNPEKLAEAADLYLNRLPASHVHSEIGLLYARRGTEKLTRRPAQKAKGKAKAGPGPAQPDRQLLARLALLESQALLDLGRAREALRHLDEAQRLDASSDTAADLRYERSVALFELCQLSDARRAFEDWLVRYPHDQQAAWAHHHLGLALEMLGEPAAAERELAEARRLQPEHFLAPLPISPAEFRAMVDTEAQALTPEQISDLKRVVLETSDLPNLRDLTLEEPPLAPTILGLFRGLPLGEEPSEPRAIVLYRKNLLRAVRSREELQREIRTTLLHELGHLRGADDDDLRERGLE